MVVTALKKADRDDSIVVRLAETDGKPGKALVSVDGIAKKAELVNFLERHPVAVDGEIGLSPFRIQTVKISK